MPVTEYIAARFGGFFGMSPPVDAFRSQRSIWGDGLADRSVSTFWSVRSWDDVDYDALAFVHPGLVGSENVNARLKLAEIVRLVLVARTWLAVHAIARARQVEPIRALANLRRMGLAKRLTGRDVFEMGPDAAARFVYGIRVEVPRTNLHSNDPWARDLGALAAIEELLCEAWPEYGCDGPAHSNTQIDLAKALSLSIHSGINAAYCYSLFECAHELLMTGVWLGHLERGRPAFMPVAVASCLGDYFPAAHTSFDHEDPYRSLLAEHAIWAGGIDRIAMIASRVRHSGSPALVPPAKARG